MVFSYSQYVRGCLIVPAVILLSSVVALISASFSCIKKIIDSNETFLSLMRDILIIIVVSFFMSMSIGRLLNGGYCLASESESDSVEIRGRIVKIENLGRFEFPELKSDYGYGEDNGVRFTIGDIQCTAPVNGNFSIGDYVIVVYLPRSGYVLSISPCENCT